MMMILEQQKFQLCGMTADERPAGEVAGIAAIYYCEIETAKSTNAKTGGLHSGLAAVSCRQIPTQDAYLSTGEFSLAVMS